LIPNPIHRVLSTFQNCGVRALLLGGQACVFYGAAEFSRDTDFALLVDEANLERLIALASEFPRETSAMATESRPLLTAALRADEAGVETGLAEEERAERTADREYWRPLKKELERMRHT
jgi:hypothetical protein